ncbi:MAG TPA: hypothetical protein ENI80_03725 [Acidiferrobacteraceae bacterium]|nr:hypothetical protein [Acidiferrobacteraceae bacterium]
MYGIPTIAISLIVACLGLLMVLNRATLGRWASSLYRRLGVDVPNELYAKQFMFVGVLLVVLGFLLATGLWSYL